MLIGGWLGADWIITSLGACSMVRPTSLSRSSPLVPAPWRWGCCRTGVQSVRRGGWTTIRVCMPISRSASLLRSRSNFKRTQNKIKILSSLKIGVRWLTPRVCRPLEIQPLSAGINARWPRCQGNAAIDRDSSYSVRHPGSTSCMVQFHGRGKREQAGDDADTTADPRHPCGAGEIGERSHPRRREQ